MKRFKLEQGDLYISQQRINERFFEGPDYHLEGRLEHFFGERPSFREYIDLYGRFNKLPRIALLEAHGDANGDWVFYDGDNGEIERSVQNWINRKDGKYSALLLCVCNPESHTPRSKKSILVVPDTTINLGINPDHEIIFDLIVPDIGNVDSYTINYEMEQLR
jgi:hypothetical protein